MVQRFHSTPVSDQRSAADRVEGLRYAIRLLSATIVGIWTVFCWCRLSFRWLVCSLISFSLFSFGPLDDSVVVPPLPVGLFMCSYYRRKRCPIPWSRYKLWAAGTISRRVQINTVATMGDVRELPCHCCSFLRSSLAMERRSPCGCCSCPSSSAFLSAFSFFIGLSNNLLVLVCNKVIHRWS